ncbi:MAG: flagellar hook-length control protein FliK [Gammaproteobacteria bacterium]|nr:MAG: flagellar hook-length control protein FliK [Gammaproteobacteria bacterium]
MLAALGNGQWRLAIANTELIASTRTSLQPGARLTLMVERGLPEPLLKILPHKQAIPTVEVLARHALARQQTPADVQRQLLQLPLGQQSRIPVVQQALHVLGEGGLPAHRLTPPMIRQALQESGLFLEPRLAAGLPPLPGDRKLLLLQLLQRLAPEQRATGLPPESGAPERGRPGLDNLFNRLQHLVEASVARIQHHQTSALLQEEPNRTLWQFDLPLQLGDRQQALPVRIEREASSAEDSETPATWKVDIHFDFSDLGAVSARVTLQGNQVSCAFRSEQDGTAERFEGALPRLKDSLHRLGLEIGAVTSLTGSLGAPDAQPPAGLVDEKA